MRLSHILLLLAPLMILGLIAVREYLLHQEISKIQSQVLESMENDFEVAADLDRILELSNSEQVFTRYIDPALHRIHSLILPMSRTRLANRWDKKVHLKLDDLLYKHTKRLAKQVREELSTLRLSQESGVNRLLKILQISADLPKASERVELIKTEVDEIQTKSRQEDQLTLNRLRSSGKENLVQLSSEISAMTEAEFIQFVSSERYFQEFLDSTMKEILKLNQEKLRAATWREFSEQLQARLQQKNRQLVRKRQRKQKEQQPEPDPANELSDLLKDEYNRLKQKEQRLGNFQTPNSPSDSLSADGLGTN